MKTLDLDLVLDHWASLEPPPEFAERVLEATREARLERTRRWPLYACALALLLVFVPLFAAPHGPHPPSAHVASVDDLDAGLRTD